MTRTLSILINLIWLYMGNEMADVSEQSNKNQQRRLAFIFHISWFSGFLIIVLLIRLLGNPYGLSDDLDELEMADTESIDSAPPLPPTLTPQTEPLPMSAVSETVYVPLYRSLYVGEQRALKILSGTLSIHNTSSKFPLLLTNLTYLNGNGETTVERLRKPHFLPPLAAAEFYIDHAESDAASVASAVVQWSGDSAITPPLIEAVIIGKYGSKGFSILSRGVSFPSSN